MGAARGTYDAGGTGMYDLIVIGAGFWGTVTAVEARRKGVETLLIDDGNPQGASRNAAGIIQESWFRQGTVRRFTDGVFTRADVGYGVDWLRENAGLNQTGEVFTSYSNTVPRSRDDVYLIPTTGSVLSLIGDRIVDTVKSVSRGDWGSWRVSTVRCEYTARRVALCAGAWTDEILRSSGFDTTDVKPLIGRALLFRAPACGWDIPHTHLRRPYNHLTIRPYLDLYRIGDTVERASSAEDGKGYQELESHIKSVLGDFRVERKLLGVRPVCDKMVVAELAPRLTVATGGHRVGLALAPAVARNTLRLLGV